MDRLLDSTVRFSKVKAQEDVQRILRYVVQALEEQGYNPVDQLAGYILSGDPTYITSYAGARDQIRGVDRFIILEHVLSSYVGTTHANRTV